jgi:deoxyribonuclease V
MSQQPRHRASSAELLEVVSLEDARALQLQLCATVEQKDRLGPVRHVAGLDVSYDRGNSTLFAAAVVLDAGSLEVVEVALASRSVSFPYVPGYLSFREIPPVLEAFAELQIRPDLVICDGQGRAHPRRFGLACHFGVTTDVPTIGCAKSRLIGKHRMPGQRRSRRCRLLDGDEVIGSVLRTRDGVQPVYVSIGHRLCLETAIRWILRLTPRYRLPEPIRAAHAEVNRLRRRST